MHRTPGPIFVRRAIGLWFVLLPSVLRAVDVMPVLPGVDTVVTDSVPSLKVAVDGISEPYNVSFFYRAAPPEVRSNFTIAVLPDTQNYPGFRFGGVPEEFLAQGEFLATNRVSKNIVYVSHVGDCVQNVNMYEEE